jgi:hypothetical protein
VLTPPSNAYWSYWHASRGGSWSYSSLGAAGYNPKAGSVEGWSYGAGARPGIAPPAAPAPPPPAPRPTTKPAPKPTVKPVPPRTSAPAGPGAPGAPATSAAPGRSSSTAAGPTRSTAPPSAGPSASTAPSTSAGPSATPDPAGSTAVAGAEATEDPGPPAGSLPARTGGSSLLHVLGFVLGGVLVVALALAGFLVARRRRSSAF